MQERERSEFGAPDADADAGNPDDGRDAGRAATSSDTAPHPMDGWLKEQLGALHNELLTERLPDQISDLAAQLEARLAGATPGDETRRNAEDEG